MAGNRLRARRRVEGLVEGMDQGEHRVRVQTRLPTAHVFALMAEYCIRRQEEPRGWCRKKRNYNTRVFSFPSPRDRVTFFKFQLRVGLHSMDCP
jgi:hypothetical protein